MPVSKSAKKALRVSDRRHVENMKIKYVFKKAIKTVKKAVQEGAEGTAELLSQAQSALDKAAKKDTIHPNKAARLKSRLAKKISTAAKEEKTEKVEKKATTKKATAKKAPANKKKK